MTDADESAGRGQARPDVPLTAVLLAIPVTLLIATIIAALPGWRGTPAAHAHPAGRLTRGHRMGRAGGPGPRSTILAS